MIHPFLTPFTIAAVAATIALFSTRRWRWSLEIWWAVFLFQVVWVSLWWIWRGLYMAPNIAGLVGLFVFGPVCLCIPITLLAYPWRQPYTVRSLLVICVQISLACAIFLFITRNERAAEYWGAKGVGVEVRHGKPISLSFAQSKGAYDVNEIVLQSELEWLSIYNVGATDDDIERIAANCRSLTFINVSDNPITNRSVLALATLPRLERLDASWTPITDVSLDALANVTTLKALHIHHTNISDAAFEEFRRQRPDVELRVSSY